MRLTPAIGLSRLNFGISASVLKLQPPSASGASIAASMINPRIGAQAITASHAADDSVGNMCSGFNAWSRVSVRSALHHAVQAARDLPAERIQCAACRHQHGGSAQVSRSWNFAAASSFL